MEKNLWVVFKFFEVPNSKRANALKNFNRLKKDNKLKGKTLEMYEYFYLVAQCIFV